MRLTQDEVNDISRYIDRNFIGPNYNQLGKKAANEIMETLVDKVRPPQHTPLPRPFLRSRRFFPPAC